jgi:hypothetical protein
MKSYHGRYIKTQFLVDLLIMVITFHLDLSQITKETYLGPASLESFWGKVEVATATTGLCCKLCSKKGLGKGYESMSQNP